MLVETSWVFFFVFWSIELEGLLGEHWLGRLRGLSLSPVQSRLPRGQHTLNAHLEAQPQQASDFKWISLQILLKLRLCWCPSGHCTLRLFFDLPVVLDGEQDASLRDIHTRIPVPSAGSVPPRPGQRGFQNMKCNLLEALTVSGPSFASKRTFN